MAMVVTKLNFALGECHVAGIHPRALGLFSLDSFCLVYMGLLFLAFISFLMPQSLTISSI